MGSCRGAVSLQIVTWTQSKWIPRLEVLAKAFDLTRFEKMVLVFLVAKHFSKVTTTDIDRQTDR